MQLRHLKTVVQPPGGAAGQLHLVKVVAVVWAPNGRKLAVATADRVVTLYDENGEKRDKFSTKPADKAGVYLVRSLAFSPDSTKLAIAQSDSIVFVYKLGLAWGDKKSICNKFPQASPVTCLAWPVARPNELVFGLAEGKVKVGQVKSNKPATLYATESYVTALACSPDGNGVISAHLDGSVYRFLFDDAGAGPSHLRLFVHACPPYALAWGHSIVCGGGDGMVVFYDPDGGVERTFDYGGDPTCKEFTVAEFNPTGDSVIVGNYNRFYVYTCDPRTGAVEEASVREVENMYSVTALSWRSDGSRVAVGTLCGVVDIYDACVRRLRYRGAFEFTYVSPSQAIVKRLSSGARIVLKSGFGCEITRINIFQDRYVVAHTPETLLLGDLETFRLSEVPWANGSDGNGGAKERFVFDNKSAALVYRAGELSIVEYGHNEVLGAVRTDRINPHLLSLRLDERPSRPPSGSGNGNGDETGAAAAASRYGGSNSNNNNDGTRPSNKKLAYLMDQQTAAVKDLVSGTTCPVPHDVRIDWLELNGRGDLLLYRDKHRQLHLFNLNTAARTTLLDFVTYVQWVPDSDVAVAQSRGTLCVWYNIHAPDQVTHHQIRGDVFDIERANGRTEVVVNEGFREATYLLDEALIDFGAAVDDGAHARAAEVLEPLEASPEADAMWAQLAEASLASGDFATAERCAAALGDVSRAKYLRELGKLANEAAAVGGPGSAGHYAVRHRLALLGKDLRAAEDALVSQGRVEDAVAMYERLQRYEEAVALARSRRLPAEETEALSRRYFQTLLDTGQEERAANLKEKEGDLDQAVRLYLKGGLPAQAARVLQQQGATGAARSQWMESVATALSAAGMHDRAGELYEQLEELPRALDSYVRGQAFRKAVDLARRAFPHEVVGLQERWGDWLVANKQVDMAINHFIEARANHKAVEASLNARQWAKAVTLIETMDAAAARPYLVRLGRHFEAANQLPKAERCFVDAGAPHLAVEMHTKAGQWEAAHRLASGYMSGAEVRALYLEQAAKAEGAGKLRDAEKLYVQVDEAELAIAMYKKHRDYDAAVRLTAKHRPEQLKETHQILAQQLEMEGQLRQAETHYAEAGEWLSAVNMYRSADMWDEALRVAKFHGGLDAQKRVAYAWALALGVEAGAKMLSKQGLAEVAIDYATESGAFGHAFELARSACPQKLPDVHLKHALILEDEERFAEAESEFVAAGKPREAVDMYVHNKDWPAALRIAAAHDPPAAAEVQLAQGDAAAAAGDRARAEEFYLAASKPEKALQMHQDAGSWEAAVRLCQRHLPHRLPEVQQKASAAAAAAGRGGNKIDYLGAGRVQEQSEQWNRAIDAYLQARSPAIANADDLEEIWERAVAVARSRVPDRYLEVVREVARRLVELNRCATAAELLHEAGQTEEAVAVAMGGGAWDKAREVARGHDKLLERVNAAYQRHLVQGEATEQLMELGQTSAVLSILAQRGDWERLWAAAAKDNAPPAVVEKYAVMRVQKLLEGPNEGLYEAVKTLEDRAAPSVADAADVYKELVRRVLGKTKDEEAEPKHLETLQSLRRVLYALAQRLKSGGKSSGPSASLLERMLMAAHYAALQAECEAAAAKEGKAAKDLMELAVRQSITLLRYTDLVPADKVFCRAGHLCRALGQESLAFVLLNRYVDLAEAIDEGESNASQLDNADMAEATAVPPVQSIPTRHYLPDEAERESVRDWVLGACMDARTEQAVPAENNSPGPLYAGLYASDLPSCIVTGYPVGKRELLEVNNARSSKRDWNTYVRAFKRDPWTGQAQTPQY